MTSTDPDPYRRPRRPGNGAPRPRRGRGRVLAPLLLAAWAVAEIWLLTLVGDAAGGLTVFALLAAGVVAGGAVVRRAGRRAWRRLAAASRQGAAGLPPQDGPPGRGMPTVLGGLLLMVPGLLSDAVGLLCLFPPTADLIGRTGTRLLAGSTGPLGLAFQQARDARQRARGQDGRTVPGEVVRDEDENRP